MAASCERHGLVAALLLAVLLLGTSVPSATAAGKTVKPLPTDTAPRCTISLLGKVTRTSAPAPAPAPGGVAPAVAPAPSRAASVVSTAGRRLAQAVKAPAPGPTAAAPVQAITVTSASIECVGGGDAGVRLIGGRSLAGFAQGFKGVDFQVDLSVPGGSLVFNNSVVVVENSAFVGLGNDGSQAPVTALDSSVLFNNVTFSGNSGSITGAIYGNSSTLGVVNCYFDRNRGQSTGAILSEGPASWLHVQDSGFADNVGYQGGAVATSGGEYLRVVNSTFLANAGQNGGSIFALEAGNVTVEASQFEGQVAVTEGGCIFSDMSSAVTIAGCSFWDSKAGGAGVIFVKSAKALRIADSTFLGNVAKSGPGAINIDGDTTIIDGCGFSSNKGTKGGAISQNSGKLTLRNSIFIENAATVLGGALHRTSANADTRNCTFTGNAGAKGGGAIYDQQITGDITACAFSKNKAPVKGGSAIFRQQCTGTVGEKQGLASGEVVVTSDANVNLQNTRRLF